MSPQPPKSTYDLYRNVIQSSFLIVYTSRCVNDMTVCGAYWSGGKKGSHDFDELAENWPSKQACCMAGHGAYESGCSAMATML